MTQRSGKTFSTTLTSGGTRIPGILNVTVEDDEWIAIDTGALEPCRAILARLRSGNTWKLSHVSDGAEYYTVTLNIAIDIIKDEATTLFYVQTVSGQDVLECILLF